MAIELPPLPYAGDALAPHISKETLDFHYGKHHQTYVNKLNELIADDLVYTHSSARLDTKQSLIGAMEAGRTVYTAVVPSDVKAQEFGDTVVLTGSARISVNSGGNAMSFGVRFTDVWVDKGGSALETKPSELFKRQIWATFQEDYVAMALIPFFGEGHLLWASDYPHPDSVWPNSRAAIERQMRELSPEMRGKLTHDNAAKLYGLS